MKIKEEFSTLWAKYFDDAELYIAFYYTDEEGHAEVAKPGSIARCVIDALSNARKGIPLCLNVSSVGCFGGKKYLGFAERVRPDFEYFLSCGIPGKIEGERYKKSPELVKKWVENTPIFRAPAQFLIFKRWDP